jgi:soluble lytic murein transglycosylase-like protein
MLNQRHSSKFFATRRSAILINGLCLVSFIIAACVTMRANFTRPLDVSRPSEKIAAVLDANQTKDSLLRLNAAIERLKAKSSDVSDAQAILQAQIFEVEGQPAQALGQWRMAMQSSQGPLGERALLGWLRLWAKGLPGRKDKLELAKLVLADTQQLAVSPWGIQKGLSNEQTLAAYLEKNMSEYISGDASDQSLILAAPSRPGIPAGDPLLLKASSSVCAYKQRISEDWAQWRLTMTKEINVYFDGLVAQCSAKTAEAVELLTLAAPKLSSQNATAHLGLEAYTRIIQMRRDTGERESVAPLYLPLLRLWRSDVVTASALGLTDEAFSFRRLEDFLAAGRARALISDYDGAKDITDNVLLYANAVKSEMWAYSQKSKSRLASIKAEASHLVAFRVFAERKEWQPAIDAAKKGLQFEDLDDEWRRRLGWILGLFEYARQNYQQAIASWQELLSDKIEDPHRAALLFWLARSHFNLKRSSEASFYTKTLIEDYPLSFYSLRASEESGEDEGRYWRDLFGSPSKLAGRLESWNDLDLAGVRENADRSKQLTRAEVFLEANLQDYFNLAMDDLAKSLQVTSSDKREVEFGVYLTRLYAMAGNWFGVISLTTKLANLPSFWDKYPEQLLIYFPTPWLKDFQQIAQESGLSPSTLMAIARQESSFRRDVKSPAFAYGLMQFTLASSRKVASQNGLQLVNGAESLYDPAFSIKLAGHYIRDLKVRFDSYWPAIYASYNAGETTVQSWYLRRKFSDPELFIEFMPYHETRQYVKSLVRNESFYNYLFSESKNGLPIK